MQWIEMKDAREHLPELIEDALAGDEVVITRDRQPLVRLVKAEAPEPRHCRFGTAKGLIEIGEDFDEPLEDY